MNDAHPSALSVRGLHKVFGQKIAVDYVDLEVPRGSFFGWWARRGRARPRCCRWPWVSCAQTRARQRCTARRLERRVASQDARGCPPGRPGDAEFLTGREVLTFLGRLRGLDADVVDSRAQELLEVMDLLGAERTLVVDYSTGMRQKDRAVGCAATQSASTDPRRAVRGHRPGVRAHPRAHSDRICGPRWIGAAVGSRDGSGRRGGTVVVGDLIRLKLALTRSSVAGGRAVWARSGAIVGAAIALGVVVLAAWPMHSPSIVPDLLAIAYLTWLITWLIGWMVGPVWSPALAAAPAPPGDDSAATAPARRRAAGGRVRGADHCGDRAACAPRGTAGCAAGVSAGADVSRGACGLRPAGPSSSRRSAQRSSPGDRAPAQPVGLDADCRAADLRFHGTWLPRRLLLRSPVGAVRVGTGGGGSRGGRRWGTGGARRRGHVRAGRRSARAMGHQPG